MARINTEPIPCENCRFNIGGVCFRNPPSSVWIGGQLNTFYPSIHNVASGCFAGEPRVQRSCRNCKIDSTCFVRIRVIGQEIWILEDWHCSEWEEKE
jgi:hypothetical protein